MKKMAEGEDDEPSEPPFVRNEALETLSSGEKNERSTVSVSLLTPSSSFSDSNGEEAFSERESEKKREEEGNGEMGSVLSEPSSPFNDINGGIREEGREEEKARLIVRMAVTLPQRQGRSSCGNYLRTGSCSYGTNCWYDHPPRKSNQDEAGNSEKGEPVEVARVSTPFHKLNGGISEAGSGEKLDEATEETSKEERTDFVGSAASSPFSDSHGGMGDLVFCKKEKEEDERERVVVRFAVPYPRRPGRSSCGNYLRTGFCSYGMLCCFDHPLRKPNQWLADVKDDESGSNDMEKSRETDSSGDINHLYYESPTKPNCNHFMKIGHCAYGDQCKFNHPPKQPTNQSNKNKQDYSVSYEQKDNEMGEFLMLNFLGLPVRQGVKDCPYYMNYGACKYSIRCRFNHPNPVLSPNIQEEEEDTSVDYKVKESKPSDGSLPYDVCKVLLPPERQPKPSDGSLPSDICRMLLPPQILDESPEHHNYEGRDSPYHNAEGYDNGGYSGNNALARSFDSLYQSEQTEYPERPGEPECLYYMKFGFCKFKLACKFHHPKQHQTVISGLNSYPESAHESFQSESYSGCESANGIFQEQMEYPDRPGQPDCSYYVKHGICKFKSACKFHHPKGAILKGPENPYHTEAYNDEPHSSDSTVTRSNDYVHCRYKITKYPERPGKLECSYYMKHGYCKFGSKCKFHHPN